MNKEFPAIIDVFYNININSSNIYKNEELIDLYKTVKNIKLDKNFISKSYFQTKINDDRTKEDIYYFDPPIGPLPPGSQCSFSECGRIGPLNESEKIYHKNNCRTPNKDGLIISKEGLNIFKNKIVKKFKEVSTKLKGKKDDEVEEAIKDFLNGENNLRYLFIFPKRGLATPYDDNKKNAFGNVIIMTYQTDPVIKSINFSTDKPDGFNISVRINKNLSMYGFTVPYELESTNFDNFPKNLVEYFLKYSDIKDSKLKDKILKEKVIKELTWISVLRGNFSVINNKNYILNLDNLNNIFETNTHNNKDIEYLKIEEKRYVIFDYKYFSNMSLINFRLSIDGISAYIEIRIRGNIKILISYGKEEYKKYGIKYYNDRKTDKNVTKLDKSLLEKVRNFLYPLFINNEKELLIRIERVILSGKIQNIFTPPEYKGKEGRQPQICNGENKKRPNPYSFKGNRG